LLGLELLHVRVPAFAAILLGELTQLGFVASELLGVDFAITVFKVVEVAHHRDEVFVSVFGADFVGLVQRLE